MAKDKKSDTKSEKQNGSQKEVAIVAISGLSWPTKSRDYLINLVKEVVVQSKAKFVIVAGHTIDGKHLEGELKIRMREHVDDARELRKESGLPALKGDELEGEKNKFEGVFITEYAMQLAEFLPVLPNEVNWHIAVAERIYDRPLGVEILKKLRSMRKDVRIIGQRQVDGYYDHEPKFPVLNLPGFEEIRVLMPHRSPWFSKAISNLVQRLTSAWAPRTLSPKPNLVLAGVTGTATHLPFYDGVPTISVPSLCKLVEKQTTEHMIGATVIRLISDGKGGVRIVNGVHNFRTAVFLEKVVAVPSTLPKVQQAAMSALIPSDASLNAIMSWVNGSKKKFGRKTSFTEEQIEAALKELVRDKKIYFSKSSNRYSINQQLIKDANITLDSLCEGSRAIKHVVWSCMHGGALKTLYFSALNDIPRLAADADACIENGDLSQGIAHKYEYNGELLPISNGVDKQEVLNAHIRATILLEIFRRRASTLDKKNHTNETFLNTCLIRYIYNAGNHDKWGQHNKQALILQLFDTTLRELMVSGVMRICQENKVLITFEQAKAAVNAKIHRIGESRMVEIDGIVLGIKHPHKGRTSTKSSRIQEVAEFLWRRFDGYMGTAAKDPKGFSITYVANFHEAAAVHITKYGQTVLGVMTGAYLKDTEFETDIDKTVDFGPAIVHARFDKEGRLLYSETEYHSDIDECDKKFVFSDRLDTEQVLERCRKLLKAVGLKMPWR